MPCGLSSSRHAHVDVSHPACHPFAAHVPAVHGHPHHAYLCWHTANWQTRALRHPVFHALIPPFIQSVAGSHAAHASACPPTLLPPCAGSAVLTPLRAHGISFAIELANASDVTLDITIRHLGYLVSDVTGQRDIPLTLRSCQHITVLSLVLEDIMLNNGYSDADAAAVRVLDSSGVMFHNANVTNFLSRPGSVSGDPPGSTGSSGVISAINSDLVLRDSLFTGGALTGRPVVQAVNATAVEIINTTFSSYVTGTYSGYWMDPKLNADMAVVSTNGCSRLRIQGCTFNGIQSPNASLYSSSSSSVGGTTASTPRFKFPLLSYQTQPSSPGPPPYSVEVLQSSFYDSLYGALRVTGDDDGADPVAEASAGDSVQLTVRNCSFTSLQDTALLAKNLGRLTITSSRFEGNQAGANNGGAVAVGLIGELSISETVFTGNTAALGGAVALEQVVQDASGTAVQACHAVLRNCSFEGNQAKQHGGAIMVGARRQRPLVSNFLQPLLV